MKDSPEQSSNRIAEKSSREGAVRTTIVGGRPPAPGRQHDSIPRGIEVLIKKASVDPAFCKVLLERRAEAAQEIALELSPAEVAAINAVAPAQLEKIIANTSVPDLQRRAFLGQVGAAMLAALTLALPGCETSEPTPSPAPPTPTPFIIERRMTSTGIMATVVVTQTHVLVTPTPSIPPVQTVLGIRPTVVMETRVPEVTPTSTKAPTPLPGGRERLDVRIEDEGAGAGTVVVRYDCAFEAGAISIDFRKAPDAQGVAITYQPQSHNVGRTFGEVTFHASGSGGTTNWLVVGLCNNAGGCQNSPALSPPSAYLPGQYSEDACAVWKIVEYHKDWPSKE